MGSGIDYLVTSWLALLPDRQDRPVDIHERRRNRAKRRAALIHAPVVGINRPCMFQPAMQNQQESTQMYKGNGIDGKCNATPKSLARRICRKGVCANITAYFRGFTSQIDAVLRRGPPILLRKRGM
jgi:hypothetical protein